MNKEAFAEFVGSTVVLEEFETEYAGVKYKNYKLSGSDTKIHEIRKKVLELGGEIRVCLPSQAQTCEYNPNRVNVNIDSNGKIKSINIG